MLTGVFRRRSSSLAHWYQVRSRSTAGYNLLTRLFEYDPKKRVTAKKALDHGYFVDEDPHPMRKWVSCCSTELACRISLTQISCSDP